MLAEGVGWISGAFGHMFLESKLITKSGSCLHGFNLFSFCLPDGVGCGEKLLDVVTHEEDCSIIVSKNMIFVTDSKTSEPSRAKGLGVTRLESQWPCGARTVAEDRKADSVEFRSIAVKAPGNYARQSTDFRFQSDQIPDTALVNSAAVVYRKNVARLRILKCLEEYVHAPMVSDWQYSSGDMAARHKRTNAYGSNSEGNPET